MNIELNLYARWDEFGYVATSPDCPGTTDHHISARQAANELARKVCGRSRYTLRQGGQSRLHYVAVLKVETKAQQELPL